jgi:drug/metabolite transporter (DMT)-like permease
MHSETVNGERPMFTSLCGRFGGSEPDAGADRTCQRDKVDSRHAAIVLAAIMLGFSVRADDVGHAWRARADRRPGSEPALEHDVCFPYRRAYLSGMNPLSFVTAFTEGELGTIAALAFTLGGGAHQQVAELTAGRHLVFWIFLGGFCWVVGDLFRQYTTKYLGIGCGIPLSNTNRLWVLAWGALVFYELAGANTGHKVLVVAGSVVMILGALAISTAVASEEESECTKKLCCANASATTSNYAESLLSYRR